MNKVILIMALLFSVSLLAEPKMPIDKNLYLQLHSSKNDFAELSHTGIIFHYGSATIDLDKLTTEEIDFLRETFTKGQFLYHDKIQNISGVKWYFKQSLDHPRFIHGFLKADYIVIMEHKAEKIRGQLEFVKLLSVQKLDFKRIPEYQEKQRALLNIRIGQEVDRITNSKIGSAPGVEMPKLLALPAPACSKLF